MEIYENEEQQVEAIKDWWKSNGKSVIAGAIIGFGLIIGWRQYNSYQISTQESASIAYEKALAAIELDDKNAQVELQGFIDANSSSQYSALASLKLASILVKDKQYAQAIVQLDWATKNGSTEIASIALLRKARLQAQLESFDDALASLALITSEAYKAKVAETKGDIYIVKGKTDEARQAYEDAISAGTQTNRSLQMKLDDLAQADAVVDVTPKLETSVSTSAAVTVQK